MLPNKLTTSRGGGEGWILYKKNLPNASLTAHQRPIVCQIQGSQNWTQQIPPRKNKDEK